MRASALLALATGLLAGDCDRAEAPRPTPSASAVAHASAATPRAVPPPPTAAAPSAAATEAPSCKPFAFDEAAARARLTKSLALVRPGDPTKFEVEHAATCAERWHALGSESLGEFFVDAVTGSIEAASICEDWHRRRVPIEVWAHQLAALDVVFDLPETAGYQRSLGAGKDAVPLVINLFSCADDRYGFAVGEKREGRVAHWRTMFVDATTLAVSVVLDDETTVPYGRWAATRAAKGWAGIDIPEGGKGGPFGYGPAERIITDVPRWGHPTKRPLEEIGRLKRVEMYGKTYPVFVIERADTAPLTAAQLRPVAVANGSFPFEIVLEPGARRIRVSGRSRAPVREAMEGGRWVRASP